jgi:ribonuclease BN (tRNA processing enzyme)
MGRVSVQFLGSGDAFGSGGRFQACILVRSDNGAFLLDCGASSLIAMKRFGVDPNSIDAILISHLHGDHFGGLPFFVLDAQFSHRREPLVIAGPPGIEERVRHAMEVFFPGSAETKQRFEIRFMELVEGTAHAIQAITLTPYAAIHASGAAAYALRVHVGEKIIAYSGDTEWTDTLLSAADGADVFICESYFFDKQVRNHLDYATLMSQRGRLTCKRLVLTHMNVDMLARVAELGIETAQDGKLIEI